MPNPTESQGTVPELSLLDQAAAEDLAGEITQLFFRAFDKFNDPVDVDGAVAFFNAELDRLNAEWLERYQPETGRRIVRAGHQVVVQTSRAVFLKIGVDLEGADDGR